MTDVRQAWIEAKNAEAEAWKAFLEANKHAPLRKELDAAIAAEKIAHEAYGKFLRGETKED